MLSMSSMCCVSGSSVDDELLGGHMAVSAVQQFHVLQAQQQVTTLGHLRQRSQGTYVWGRKWQNTNKTVIWVCKFKLKFVISAF